MYINFLVLERGDCSLFSLSQNFAFSVASRANTASPRRVASCFEGEPHPFTIHYSKRTK